MNVDDLDDLKQVWAAHGAVLERSLAINERLLRETMLRKVRFAQAPYVVWRVLEVVFGIVMLLAVMPVLVRHLGELRYLAVAGPFAVFVIALTAMCTRLLVATLRLDYGGSVASLQRDIAQLKLAEVRTFKWALLGGIVGWLPALLLAFEGVTGIEGLARVDLGFLIANITFGLGVLAIGMWWSRKYVERAKSSRLIDALSGRSLRVMEGHLAELAAFEREAR
jgi:hypothetical protein